MPLETRLDSITAAANMAEIEPAYSDQQAKVESDRCLYCFDAPCITACPTGIDVPGFIKKIANQNLSGAGRVILEANILGASCARACPTSVLCEGACVLMDRDEMPIKIGRLQRHATDYIYENNLKVLPPSATSTGKTIALIGGGPASLSCAAELARLGHKATIYEKNPQAGGLNTYGIAYYKLKPQVSLKEVEMVKSLGVEIKHSTTVGKDIAMQEILETYDAIFLGIGLGEARWLGIPGEDKYGVFEALDFIGKIHTVPLHQIPIGRHVVIIGCGNTAIDAATQAKRLGAETATIIYRRGEKDMPAYPHEYELAKADGCEFIFHASPTEILEEDGAISSLHLVKTQLDSTGTLLPIEGSEFKIPCDMLLKASGQEKQTALLKKLLPELKLDRAGRIQIDTKTGRTSLVKIYAGGDANNGGSEIVNAVAEGKKAARGIHLAFTGETITGPIQATRHGVPGSPIGSGFDSPVRVPELEAEYRKKLTAQ